MSPTRAQLRAALRAHGGNVTRAAVALGLPRGTLRDALVREGLLHLAAGVGRPVVARTVYEVDLDGRAAEVTVGPEGGLTARWVTS